MVKKVNQKRVTNSKELRKLRAMLPDSVAREHFLSEAILKSATLRLLTARRRSPRVLLKRISMRWWTR